jgi:hypothetical protein
VATRIHVQYLIAACLNIFIHGVTEILMYIYGTAVMKFEKCVYSSFIALFVFAVTEDGVFNICRLTARC